MDPPLAPIVFTTAGTIALLAALGFYLRDRRKPSVPLTRPWPTGSAAADPLGGFWNELDWFVREDPRMDYALSDLDRVIALISEPEFGGPRMRADPTPAFDAIDLELVLKDLRTRAEARLLAGWRRESDADPLHAYLHTLGAPEDLPEPTLGMR